MPQVLQKYLPGAPEFIPFSKELPKDTTSQKAKSKTDKGGAKQKAAAAGAAAAEAAEKVKSMVV